MRPQELKTLQIQTKNDEKLIVKLYLFNNLWVNYFRGCCWHVRNERTGHILYIYIYIKGTDNYIQTTTSGKHRIKMNQNKTHITVQWNFLLFYSLRGIFLFREDAEEKVAFLVGLVGRGNNDILPRTEAETLRHFSQVNVGFGTSLRVVSQEEILRHVLLVSMHLTDRNSQREANIDKELWKGKRTTEVCTEGYTQALRRTILCRPSKIFVFKFLYLLWHLWRHKNS